MRRHWHLLAVSRRERLGYCISSMLQGRWVAPLYLRAKG
jgi:hypothetical protein